jgi:hypothetical protein
MIYITFSDVTGHFLPSLLSMGVTFPLNDLPVAGHHNYYQWFHCEQAVVTLFHSKN